MKLYIDGEYRDVSFWSLFKCIFLVELVIGGIIWFASVVVTAIMIASIGGS